MSLSNTDTIYKVLSSSIYDVSKLPLPSNPSAGKTTKISVTRSKRKDWTKVEYIATMFDRANDWMSWMSECFQDRVSCPGNEHRPPRFLLLHSLPAPVYWWIAVLKSSCFILITLPHNFPWGPKKGGRKNSCPLVSHKEIKRLKKC